jgi:hypothetical protein
VTTAKGAGLEAAGRRQTDVDELLGIDKLKLLLDLLLDLLLALLDL